MTCPPWKAYSQSCLFSGKSAGISSDAQGWHVCFVSA